SDTVVTNIRWHCKKGKLNVAEIACFALDEIIFFPRAVITKMQFDLIIDGCWTFYDYFFENKNKAGFQKTLKEWYSLNAKKYRPITIPGNKLSTCKLKYNINIYYDWED